MVHHVPIIVFAKDSFQSEFLEIGCLVRGAGHGASSGTLDDHGGDIPGMLLRPLGCLLFFQCQYGRFFRFLVGSLRLGHST